MLSEAMERFIKEHEKEAYDLLLTIAKIPSPSNHEEKRAQFCCNWLKEQGAEGVYIDEALNVVYPAALRDNVDVYMAHTDVVFPDETELPLKVENGRICCPGVGDDTACLVCVLLAAKYTALMIKEGKLNQIRPETEPGLIFVCNSGEEGLGNLKGVKKICEDYGSRMNTFCTFDGSLEHLVDEAVGSNRYKVTVRTQGGHSFGNFGRDNAIEKLAGIIEKLYRIQVPEGGKTTYNVGTISGGTSVNTIAQEASMLYEFRSDRKVNLAYMKEKFEAAVDEAKARIMLRNEICGDISFLKIRLIEKFIQKIHVSFYSFDGNFSKCTDHLSNGTAAVFVINNDLGNHRIIVGRDCIVIINCCIHADSVSTGKM